MGGVKRDDCFTRVLEDPFTILFEEMNNTNVFNFLRFGFMDVMLNELAVRWIWIKLVQSRWIVDKMIAWLHWHFDFT